MHRFFVSPADISADLIRLSQEDSTHIRALRLRPAESFIVCDGIGTDYVCRLGKQDGGSVAEIIEAVPSLGEPSFDCTVFIAFSKGSKLDIAVQKSVELGACRIILFPSERGDKADLKKIPRLQRIALEAAKQSGRGIVPAVTAEDTFDSAVIHAVSTDFPLFFYECESETTLRDALSQYNAGQSVSIFTGPEGGFTDREADTAKSSGMTAVTLGKRILRCETAPIAALAAVMYHTGDL
ncbi:MAG: 16S rRNA (uracil(1498)-N(3))-methyltransferase [Oscillospiraceae bacterium]|nr:16S rRNA (uracil(1498)-N(3))-methyltransferase [Oscillospiraceae bacterium]